MTQSAELGKFGEDIAGKFLENIGYKIIDKNFKTKFGEIDIIAKDKNTFVFIEVKTRNSDEYGAPQLAVNNYKKKHLMLSALTFIKKNSLYSDYRFDIIAINNYEIEHIKNAFVFSGYTV